MLFSIPKKMIFTINKILCVNLTSFSMLTFLAILNGIASKAILMKRKPGRVEQSCRSRGPECAYLRGD